MIQRRTFQIWLGKDMPKDITQRVLGMERMNRDMEYRLYRDEIFHTYGDDPYVRHMVESQEKTAFIVDRLRVLLLRDVGGLYVDADAVARKPWSSMPFWNYPHIDFVAGMRSPHRPGVALHRGIAFVDNTVMGSAKNGRMVNRLCGLYTSESKRQTGHSIGIEIHSSADETTALYSYKYFYSQSIHPETVVEHDGCNLGSWIANPTQFAIA